MAAGIHPQNLLSHITPSDFREDASPAMVELSALLLSSTGQDG